LVATSRAERGIARQFLIDRLEASPTTLHHFPILIGGELFLVPGLRLICANFKCEISLSYSPSPSPLPPGERVSKSPSLDGRGKGRGITY